MEFIFIHYVRVFLFATFLVPFLFGSSLSAETFVDQHGNADHFPREGAMLVPGSHSSPAYNFDLA